MVGKSNFIKGANMMSCQEPDLFQENQDRDADDFDSAVINRLRLAMLRLKSSSSTTITQKRRSPSSFSSFQEPSPKRALYPPPTTTSTTISPPLLPPPPPTSSSNTNHPNTLRTSLSDITALSRTVTAQSPENSFKNNADLSAFPSPSPVTAAAPTASLALPPLPPATLLSTLSDPTAITPPRPQVASPSPGQESHESKRLEGMKKKLKEMSQWMEKIVAEEEEEEEDDAYAEDNCNVNSSNSKV